MFDVHVMLVFGVVGYLFGRLDVPIAPVVLGLVLGKMMEQSFRQAMTISDGSLRIFVGSDIAVTLLVACCIAMAVPVAAALLARRRPAERPAA
jgi:putative tricarboxylic transport membrane protein